MPVPVTLVSGLDGAIGSDFRRAQNQLVFVEFNGKLSRLNLFRTGTAVSSGTAVLKGTWTFDLDTGAEGGLGPNFDITGTTTLATNSSPGMSSRSRPPAAISPR